MVVVFVILGGGESNCCYCLFLQVKVLYVRNLKSDISEDELKEKFEPFGKIERVKKIKDYGFVHFEERDSAVKAMDELNGQVCYVYAIFITQILTCL